jgi:speckle-type POZ protein
MKEGTGTDIVTIDGMEPLVFSALLTFIYIDTWPEINEEDEPTVAQHLLVAVDRYALLRLKLMCEDRLLRHIDAGSVAALLALGEQHHCSPGLKNACFEFLLSSTDSLLALVETEDFDHLALSCPAMVKEMIFRLLLARDLEKAKLNESCRGIRLFPGIKYPLALTMATDKSGASNPPSATVSEKAHHILKIDGLSSTCEALGDFHSNSCRFRVGGYNWHVRMRPKGTPDGNNMDSISFFLVLDDDPVDVEAVMAQVTFSLLDRDHKPVPSYSHTTPMVNLSEKGLVGSKGFIRRRDLEQSGHLKDDCFAVRADIHVVVKKLKPVVPPPDMHRHLGDLLSSKEGVDVEFRVGGETFGAHRLVLAARSSPTFWAQLCVSENDEGSAINVVEIDGMDAQVFRALLSFVYTDTWPGTDDGEDEFAMAQRLLDAADMYGMPRLKLTCENRLSNHIDTASAATILSLAEKHRCAGLKKACFEFLCSWTALNAARETDDFKYFAQSYPTVVEHLRSNIRARYHVKGTVVGWNHKVCINVQMMSPIAVLTAKSHGEDLPAKFRRQQAEIQRLLNIGILVSMK